MNIEEKLYTSTEVAEVLGVSLRSVYRYLEQGKLGAEIKTATGRLRFTKKNITDFLYPGGVTGTQAMSKTVSDSLARASEQGQGATTEKVIKDMISHEEVSPGTIAQVAKPEDISAGAIKAEITQPAPVKVVEASPAPEPKPEQEPKPEPKQEPEIDWLSKFEQVPSKTPASGKPSVETDSVSSLASATEEEKPSEISFKYYKSMLGGLKEIAQNIDKVGRKSGVDYAFTLYAGLSLDKPLKKPFSVLNVYVSPSTEPLFKRMLQLEETDASNGQLCLMFTDDTAIFANKVEKHGLFVVSSDQLVEDFRLLGLADELYKLE